MNTIARLITTFFLTTTALHAQSPAAPAPDHERVIYDAAFYTPYTPRTALDMVKQTPGFVLDIAAVDELRRGFTGAVGNVLIDGERLSAKSQTLSDVLQRVPAGEVLRIEILRGSAVAGDASGAAVLANVVRTRSTGGGAWQAGAEYAAQHEAAPNGWFGWGGRRGLAEYSLGGSTYSFARELPGDRTVRNGDDELVARRHDESPREFGEYALNGQVAHPAGGGRLVFTGQAAYSRYHDESTLLTTTPAGAPLADELTPYTESNRSGEAGVTWQRALSLGDLEIAALATRTRFASHVSSTHFDAAGVEDEQSTLQLQRDSGESILRATLARHLPQGQLEIGVEAALNTLDSNLALALDFGAGPFPIDVENGNLRVRENRGEAFVSASWRSDERWSLDARLAAEISTLSFSGDTKQSVSLSYVKPRVQLTRTLGKHQLQLRLFRDVSQLDFTDFVSAASLADDLISGGNPDLKPQTAWVAEVDADLRFPGDAALRVRVFHHWLDDVVDFIPVGPPGARLDASGNIGAGTLDGIALSLRLPLTHLLAGASFSLSGTWQDSDVRDPVTGERRPISALAERELEAELRQDLTAWKLSWGVSFADKSALTAHRRAETDRREDGSSLDAFIETTAIAGTKLRLTMVSMLGDPATRERRSYSPDRTGVLSRSELGERHPGHWWMMTVSRSF